jgi:chaperone BCS1
LAGESEEKGGITLSGLLNVIDGVAASEGRILIMTTNHVENVGCAIRFDGAVLEGAILGGGI